MDGIFKNKINALHSCLMEKASLTHQVSDINKNTILKNFFFEF